MTVEDAVIPAGALLPDPRWLRLPLEPIYTTTRNELIRRRRVRASSVPPWPEATP